MLVKHNFFVIDKKAEPVVVLYGEAEKLIEAYKAQPPPKNIITKEKLGIIRKLEKYSVSLVSWEMEELEKIKGIHILDEDAGVKYLSREHYSHCVGAILKAEPLNYIV